MPVLFAHMGHVLIDLPIFFGPVAVLSVWFVLASWRDTRAAKKASRQKARPSTDRGK
jgi:hypothetical protein